MVFSFLILLNYIGKFYIHMLYYIYYIIVYYIHLNICFKIYLNLSFVRIDFQIIRLIPPKTMK